MKNVTDELISELRNANKRLSEENRDLREALHWANNCISLCIDVLQQHPGKQRIYQKFIAALNKVQ
jgi:hypothetical protein